MAEILTAVKIIGKNNVTMETLPSVPVVSLLNFFGTMLVPKIAEKGVLLRSKRGPRFREKGG